MVKVFDVGIVLTTPPNGRAPENSGYDGDLITPEWVTRYVSEHAATLVVGVEMWYRVRAVRSTNDIILTATVCAVDRIVGQNFDGQEVTAEWLKGYIEGTAEYLLAPGCVTVSAAQVRENALTTRLVP